MYRLTICQTDINYPYIVYDTSKFISYDLKKSDGFLEDTSTLEDVTLPELRKEGYV